MSKPPASRILANLYGPDVAIKGGFSRVTLTVSLPPMPDLGDGCAQNAAAADDLAGAKGNPPAQNKIF
jgi:hypothetical protein